MAAEIGLGEHDATWGSGCETCIAVDSTEPSAAVRNRNGRPVTALVAIRRSVPPLTERCPRCLAPIQPTDTVGDAWHSCRSVAACRRDGGDTGFLELPP